MSADGVDPTDPRPDPPRPGLPRRIVRARPTARVAAACVLAGVLLAASLPPWGFWPLALAGIALLDVLLADRPRASRAGRMGLVALVLFAITLFWIKDLTAPGYVIAAVVFAAMFAVFGMLVPPGRGRHLALPGVWVLAEVWKGHWPFGGVPISDLAIGQVGGPFAEVARLGGAPLLSGVAVAFGVVIAAIATRRDRGTLLGAGAGLAVLVILLGLAAIAPRGHDIGAPIRFAVVQGGGKQGTQAVFTDTDKVFARHLKEANTITGPVDVVLWPEDVVDLGDGDITDPGNEKGQALSDLARRLHATVIAGVVENAGDTHFLNYSVVVRPDGTFGGRYEKVHRVPFGEYVPFRSLIAPFAGPALTTRDAVPGTGPAVVHTAHGTFGVVISWEVFFSERARAAIRDGGEVLLNPTNGSTYTLTLVQTQQVAASRLRAIETGRWVLQAAPTGFSAVISPSGTVEARTGISQARVLRASVRRRTGFTISTRTGGLPTLLLAGLLVLAAWWSARRTPATGPSDHDASAEAQPHDAAVVTPT